MECCCINLEKEEGKESAERNNYTHFFKFLYTLLLIDLFNLIVKHEHNVREK